MATQPTGPVKTLRMSREPAATPIVDNPKLKAMSGSQAVLKRIGGKVLRMDDQATNTGGDTLMKALPSHLPSTGAPTGALTGASPKTDQVEVPGSPAGQEAMSVRLRLRITRGQVSVVAVHAVPGVLPPPERLDYGLAYEIRNGNRRVAVGSVPDVGMRRSFPDPQGRAGMQGHHLQELETIEVNLRLPQREFSAASLSKLNVQLFRMKGQPPAGAITSVALAEQFKDQLRAVAELRGIDTTQLPARLQSAVSQALFPAPVKALGSPR